MKIQFILNWTIGQLQEGIPAAFHLLTINAFNRNYFDFLKHLDSFWDYFQRRTNTPYLLTASEYLQQED